MATGDNAFDKAMRAHGAKLMADVSAKMNAAAEAAAILLDGPPVTFTASFNFQSPSATCKAEPCAVCGACSTCRDFHDYTGRGCTDETCPLLTKGT